MTDAEIRAVQLLGEAWNAVLDCVPDGQSQREACAAIHQVQHLVMAQSAIRANPDLFRSPLPSTLKGDLS